MFLVVMHVFAGNFDIPCVVAETMENAQEWIDKEMQGKEYTGGVHRIKKVPFYK